MNLVVYLAFIFDFLSNRSEELVFLYFVYIC